MCPALLRPGRVCAVNIKHQIAKDKRSEGADLKGLKGLGLQLLQDTSLLHVQPAGPLRHSGIEPQNNTN